MMGAIENSTRSIHRVRVGAINLGDLAPGKWRQLTKEEIAAVLTKKVPGLRNEVEAAKARARRE